MQGGGGSNYALTVRISLNRAENQNLSLSKLNKPAVIKPLNSILTSDC